MKTTKRLLLVAVLVMSFFLFAPLWNHSAIAEEEAPSVRIAGRTLSLKENVYITYYVDLDGAKAEDVCMLYYTSAKGDYTAENADSRSECLGFVTVEGKEYGLFRYTSLTAKQMTDVIYARAYFQKNGAEFYSNTDKYSIALYAYNKRGTQEEALCTAMLAFGGEAQLRFSYRTEDLASAIHHRVDVEGGVLEDGFSYGLYVENAMATVTAQEREHAVFSCWTVNGTPVCYDRVYSFSVTEAFTLIANFETGAHEHRYTETIEREATCSAVGQKRYECACGESYTEEIPRLLHQEQTEAGQVATCTQAGRTDRIICAVCGTILQEATELPAKGHTLVNHAGQEASCSVAGWKAYVSCTECDYSTYQETPRLPHTYSGDACTSCGKGFYSDGLEFVITGDACTVWDYTETAGEIVLPVLYEGSLVTKVESGALQGVDTIFYRGSEGEWQGIEGVSSFEGTVYFYAESQPSDAGYYWYHVDGAINIW